MKRVFKRFLAPVLRVIISTCLVYLVVSRVGWHQLWENIRLLDPFAFGFALLVYVLSIIIFAKRWKLFIPAGIGMKGLSALTYIGAFFNICLPGSIGGDVVRAYYLSREPDKDNVTAFGSVIADRFAGLVALLVIGIAATFLGSRYFSNHPVRWLIPSLLGSAVIVLFVALYLRAGRSIPLFVRIYSYIDSVAARRKEIGKAVLYSVVTQLLIIVSFYVLGKGLSINAPFVSFLCFVPIVSIVSLIPVTISGIGLREGAFVILFGLIGVLPDKATALSIVWFLSIVIGSLPGLVIYLFYRRSSPVPIGKTA